LLMLMVAPFYLNAGWREVVAPLYLTNVIYGFFYSQPRCSQMWRILLRTLLWSSAVGQQLAGMSLRRLPVIAKAM